MSDHSELKKLAEAFPSDLDWDSNTEPFFNGPSGESLGGGPTGFCCVYGAAFEIDDEQYDGPTYVETCKADFAKFMVAAREGVLALIAEVEALKHQADSRRKLHSRECVAMTEVQGDLIDERDKALAEVEALRKDSDIRKWQTMESCPHHKDVIFYREDAGVFSGKLTCADEFMSDSERDEGLLTEEEQFALDAWSYEPEGIYRLDGDLVPTHWMPYPCDPELTQ
jgi:hypothetical protein